LIRGETKLVDACREHDLKQSEVEASMETFVQGGERSLKARSEDEQVVHEREVRELRAKVGELVLELDARKQLDALSAAARGGRAAGTSGRVPIPRTWKALGVDASPCSETDEPCPGFSSVRDRSENATLR
jgi:hypothetical protein